MQLFEGFNPPFTKVISATAKIFGAERVKPKQGYLNVEKLPAFLFILFAAKKFRTFLKILFFPKEIVETLI